MNTKNGMERNDWRSGAIGFAIGFVIGAGFLWMWQSSPTAPATPDTNENQAAGEEDTMTVGKVSADVSVEVSDQPAGRAAVVDAVSLTTVGWVTVREIKKDGSVGNILGAARRGAGNHNSVIIDLLRSTEPGSDYLVVLYADDGDLSFDSKIDALLTSLSPDTDAHRFSAQTPVSPSGI